MACLALALTSGCAPRLSTLIAGKHYREAVCAAHDGGAARRRRVSEALAADSGLYVHLQSMSQAELAQRVDPALAGEVLARVDLVKITVQANTLPLDDLQLQVTVQGEDMGAGAAAIGWETLAVATGETVPDPERYTSYATLGNLLRSVGVVVTVGLSLPYTNFNKRVYTLPPSSEAYRQQMPRAAALLAALGAARCEALGDAGQVCTGHFVFDRSPATQWTLTLAQTYVAQIEPRRACTHERAASVQIGRAAEWPAMFGPRMRGLAELPAGRVTTSWQRDPEPPVL